MSTEMVDRSIPERFLPTYQPILVQAHVAFYQERYNEAVNLFRGAHEALLDAQRQIGRAIHKGHTFYNLGLSLLGIRDTERALNNILLAYVEDTLNTRYDFEDDADRAPAARFLMDGFAIQLRLLREIKNGSRAIKRSTESWLRASDPESILHSAATRLNIAPNNVLSLCERPDVAIGPAPLGFPQPRERRVFMGLDYDTHSHLIPEMRVAIIGRNYIPVAARDVIVPQGANVHDISLLLLHTCGWAVFDVTQPAGQFMEIERAHDYHVHVLLIRSYPVSHPPHVSQMIASLGYPLETYRDMPELRQRITNFLLP